MLICLKIIIFVMLFSVLNGMFDVILSWKHVGSNVSGNNCSPFVLNGGFNIFKLKVQYLHCNQRIDENSSKTSRVFAS